MSWQLVLAAGHVDGDGCHFPLHGHYAPPDPASAATPPVPQAVAGTVEPSAAPATRTDVGMCRCGHSIGEHDIDYAGECTGLIFPLSEGPPPQCGCPGYVPAGGAA